MKNKLIITAVIALLAIGIGFFALKRASAPGSQNLNQGELTGTVEDPKAGTAYTQGEVAGHAGKESCWATIRGNVYDLTSWIGKHPGGQEAILALCGRDATVFFERQHGGEPLPESILADYKIGILKE